MLNDIQYPIYHRHPAKLVWLFCSIQTIFSKDDKNIEKNTETILIFLFLLWQCCDLIMNISYQCLEFITAESHLINFLWIIKHWRKLMKLHEICHQSLQMGGVNILLDQVDNSVIDRMGAVSGGGNEDRSLIRSKWKELRSSVVTEKVGQETMQGLKKENFSFRGWRAKYEWTLCDIFIIWSFFLENAHEN